MRWQSWLVVVLALGLSACSGGVSSHRSSRRGPGSPRVSSPVVQRDLPQIQDEGVLRVLLRNSSSSYYILRGEEFGFEYELADAVARQLGLRLDVVLPDSQKSALTMLNLGDVDVVGTPIIAEDAPDADLSYCSPYGRVRQVLVVHEDYADQIRSAADLAGQMVAVRHWSSEERSLIHLREEGIDVGIVMHPPETATEEILDMVADGTYQAALVHDNVAEPLLRYRPELQVVFPLGEAQSVRWAVRSNSPELLAALDSALQQHYRIDEDGHVERSVYYNVLWSKYFSDERYIRRREEDPFRYARTGRLSPYDDLFRAQAIRYGLDWRLLAAVAFQESSFDPTSKSWAGAIGLMQLRPTTASVSEDSLLIPEVNVAIGTRHLRQLYDSYRYLDDRTRMEFALAAYNCGKGHLDDARVLSIMRGKDPNEWEGSVRESLLLLRKPHYHRQVRYGYVRGTETVNYVQKVMRRYATLEQLSQQRRPVTAARVGDSRANGAAN